MEVNIKIENYLSESEIKDIIKETVKEQVRYLLGNRELKIAMVAKSIAKDEIQELIPDFKEQLATHIQEQIKTITLGDFFATSIGWKSEGSKIFNGIMSDNKELIDQKIKEIFNNI